MAIWDSIRARFSPASAAVVVTNATILQVIEANQEALLSQLATISGKLDGIAGILSTTGLAQLLGDLSLIKADLAAIELNVAPIAGDYQTVIGQLSEILAIVGPSKIVGDPTSIATEHQPLPPR